IAWSTRYRNRIAPLMIATGFLWLARQLRYSHNSALFTLFFLFGDLAYAMAGHVALAYPSGRVRDKWELWIVRAGYTSVLLFTFVDRPPSIAYNELFWWQIFGFIAFLIAIVDGLLRARLAHAGVGDLVLELERTPQHRLGETLSRALRDRTLEIAFWVPNRGEYEDAFGRTIVLPTDGIRAVTKLDSDGEPVAALIHDPSLLEDPTLVGAAAAAARLSLENARLHAETRAQLAQVQESRARIVTAADEERRRIERDIHDGAQQRLVALGLQLRSAQRTAGAADDPQLRKPREGT